MHIITQVQTGLGKKECEDSALIFCENCKEVMHEGKFEHLVDGRFIVAVADGVGGNLGARDASTFVLNKLLKNFLDEKSQFSENYIRAALTEINYELVEYSSSMGAKHLMATTFTAIFFDGSQIIMAHAGNTRLNAINKGFIHQYTTDHSTYQFLLDIGKLEEAEHCNRAEIYSFFGGGDVGGMRRLEIKVIPSDELPSHFVLTSDGVHDFTDLDFWESLFTDRELSDQIRAERLISKALENGSCDDKTVMIVRLNNTDRI